MAIIGETDLIVKNGIPPWQLMAKIGTVRKGEPKGVSKFPKELDYFRIDLEPNYAHYQSVVDELYGDEPKEINHIKILPDQDVENLAWMEAYDGTHTVKVRCDGLAIERMWNQERNAYDMARRPCQRAEDGECPLGCKRVGRMTVALWDFYVETGEYGYFTFLTGGKADVKQWMGTILAGREMFRDIRDVFYTARRVPEKMTQITNSGRALIQHYNVKFMLDKEYAKLALAGKEATPALLRSTLPALPAVAGAEDLTAEEVANGKARLGPGANGRRIGDEPKEAVAEIIEADFAPATDDGDPKISPHTIETITSKPIGIELVLSSGLILITRNRKPFVEIGIDTSGWVIGDTFTNLNWFGVARFETSGDETKLTEIVPPKGWTPPKVMPKPEPEVTNGDRKREEVIERIMTLDDGTVEPHAHNILKKLEREGKVTADMTVDEIVEAAKARHDDEATGGAAAETEAWLSDEQVETLFLQHSLSELYPTVDLLRAALEAAKKAGSINRKSRVATIEKRVRELHAKEKETVAARIEFEDI